MREALMRGNSLRVVARIVARPDSVDEVRELLRGLVGPTRGEAGCVSYELLQNRDDPTDFTFVEEWTGDAALEAHLNSPHLRGLPPEFDEMASVDIRKYTLVE
jgi:quinol monooxygenase YgiN